MHYDEKWTIINIMNRFGRTELHKFIDEYSAVDAVEMIEAGGYGEQLLEWYKGFKPEEFFDEDTDQASWFIEQENAYLYREWARQAI